MGNVVPKEIESHKSDFFQDKYSVVTLGLVPLKFLPQGLTPKCVGEGPLLGNWEVEHAVTMDYSMGLFSTSFIIPRAAQDLLEFVLILKGHGDDQPAYIEKGPRRSLPKDSKPDQTYQYPCRFQVPAESGAMMSVECTVKVSLKTVSALDLAASHSRPMRAYFEAAPQVAGQEQDCAPADQDSSVSGRTRGHVRTNSLSPQTSRPESPVPGSSPSANPNAALSWTEFVMLSERGQPLSRTMGSYSSLYPSLLGEPSPSPSSAPTESFSSLSLAAPGSEPTSSSAHGLPMPMDSETFPSCSDSSPPRQSSETLPPFLPSGAPNLSVTTAATLSVPSAHPHLPSLEQSGVEAPLSPGLSYRTSSVPGGSLEKIKWERLDSSLIPEYSGRGGGGSRGSSQQHSPDRREDGSSTSDVQAIRASQDVDVHPSAHSSSALPSLGLGISPGQIPSMARPPTHPNPPTSASANSLGSALSAANSAPNGQPESGSNVVEQLSSRARRRLALVLVGLPGRGKTFTSTKLTRYLQWMGQHTRHFNVGNYRRNISGSAVSANWFDNKNEGACEARDLAAKMCMTDMLEWMEKDGGQVGVYDATNSTIARRRMLADMCRGRCKLVFLETISNDPKLILANVNEKISHSADYNGMDKEEARRDFLERIKKYEESYEPVGRESSYRTPGGENAYIKLIDTASGSGHVQVNRLHGWLPGRIVSFLLNLSYSRRPFFLCRHGETIDNTNRILGGDGSLSPSGKKFAKNLSKYIQELPAKNQPCSVWISSLKRTNETANYLTNCPKVYWRVLDEIDAGVFDGMTYEQIKEKMPEEYAARQRNKLKYRYPRGESYLDVIQRLESVIIELERQSSPVLIIAHQAVIRCLFAYVMNKSQKEIPFIEIPLHTLICLNPGIYNTTAEFVPLGPETKTNTPP